jgi:PPOX class probable F420-dependent enzyme
MTPAERDFLATARTATLATLRPDGRARLVPICFVLADGPLRLYSALDDKPKSVEDPRVMARVRDIERRPEVTLLVDRWDEDWNRLGWLRCDGRATLVEPAGEDHPAGVRALRAKYPQYETHDLEHRPLMRIDLDGIRSWGALSDPGRAPAPPAADSGSSSSPGDIPRH